MSNSNWNFEALKRKVHKIEKQELQVALISTEGRKMHNWRGKKAPAYNIPL